MGFGKGWGESGTGEVGYAWGPVGGWVSIVVEGGHGRASVMSRVTGFVEEGLGGKMIWGG